MSSDSSKKKKTVEHPSPELGAPQTSVVPWNGFFGAFYTIVLFFVSQYLIVVFFAQYVLSRHWTQQEAIAWLDSSVAAQFVFVFAIEAVALLGVILFLRGYKVSLRAIGLKRPRADDVLWAIGMVLPYLLASMAITAVAQNIFPSLNVNQNQEIGFKVVNGFMDHVMVFISLVVLPPIVEEIMARGLLFSSLRKFMPLAGATIITSALFAAAHLSGGGSGGPLWVGAIDTFTLSLFLIYLRVKTGSLWAGIGLHAIKNGIAFVYLFVAMAR
jgi:membrane protease YdiL (CAAX protease family)